MIMIIQFVKLRIKFIIPKFLLKIYYSSVLPLLVKIEKVIKTKKNVLLEKMCIFVAYLHQY